MALQDDEWNLSRYLSIYLSRMNFLAFCAPPDHPLSVGKEEEEAGPFFFWVHGA